MEVRARAPRNREVSQRLEDLHQASRERLIGHAITAVRAELAREAAPPAG